MGVLDQLDTEQGDAPDESAAESPETGDRDMDPFSCGYDFEEWKLDSDSTDQALSLLIAVTNLV